MSKAIGKPVTQKRLTNIALVKYRKKGKRFEIACYPNKVFNWRNKVETDVDEVLQTPTVFNNVSKGVVAKSDDLRDVFGTDDHLQCCLRILDKGDYQVSEKERKHQLEKCALISPPPCQIDLIPGQKCVNPESQRPYPLSAIERALRDAHFAVNPSRNPKQQALEAIALLRERIPIARARMRLRLSVPKAQEEELRELLSSVPAHIETARDEAAADGSIRVWIDCVVDPGEYRRIEERCAAIGGGRGTVEVVTLSVQRSGDAPIDREQVWAPSDTTGAQEVGVVSTAGGGGAAVSSHDSRAGSRSAGSTPVPRPAVSKSLGCNACGSVFESRAEQLEHLRSDWHRLNLKQKVKQQPHISRDEYNGMAVEELRTRLEEIL